MRIYLPIAEIILDIHDAVLEISGGRPGVRDAHIIDAAINRPKSYLSYHGDCDIHTVCAVLLDSISRNHAFVDGNKRTGLMTAILTYEINDINLNLDAKESAEFEATVLWVVIDKPEISEITGRLKATASKYQHGKSSAFAKTYQSTIEPFDSENG